MRTSAGHRLLNAIKRQPVDQTPVWIMRQAGRYLPEYREIRQKAGSFMTLCKTPELATTVTLQPLARFPLDAAILFSDILTIPDAMGLGLYFQEGEGPRFERPLKTERDIKKLSVPDPETELAYVLETIRLLKPELKVPLIGFCGSPWTLATYMIEGSIRNEPELLHHLLNILAKSVSAHLNAQIKAGVDVVMIFDTWGGRLNTEDYLTYSLPYVKQIISELDRNTPVILFTKGGGQWLELMANSGCHVLGIDWEQNLTDAKKRVGHQVALQGNLNPTVLYESPEVIQQEVKRVLKEFGEGPGHIFNLGHGIPPDVLPEKVAILVEAVHQGIK